MSNFGVEIKEDVIAACKENRDEIEAILERVLDKSYEVKIEAAPDIEFGSWPEEVEKAGLVLTFEIGDQAAVAVLPLATGMVPIWSRKPDATGQSKLETFALELGMNILPEEFMPENSKAAWIDDVPVALDRGTGDALAAIHIELQQGDFTGTMYLWLPIGGVADVWGSPEPPAEEAEAEAAPAEAVAEEAMEEAEPSVQPIPALRGSGENYETLMHRLESLPTYTRSLLRVNVPIMVNLASTKTTLSNVLDMGPGTIIQFEKGCDELLRLAVSGYEIAEGEAVKVGDKFGFRVSRVLLPPERFTQVRKSRQAS